MDLSLSDPIILTLVSGSLVGLLLSWYVFISGRVVTDQATSRSLHQGRAVTGGGLWMFVPVAVFIIWLHPAFMPAYLLLLMAWLGFADDRFDLSFKPRLLAQLLITVICLYWFGHLPGWFGLFLMVALIWWMNLFNFMDGANGMAGLHGLVIVSFHVMLGLEQPALMSLMYATWGVMVVYLVFNLILRRLFMGDSGSLPLAFLVALLAFGAVAEGTLSYHQIALIHAVFITDATLTLLLRIKAGENITQAHASHLYQRIIKTGVSHARVSITYALITALLCGMAWVLPHWLVWQQMLAVVGIYLILVVIFSKTLNLGR